MCHAGTVEAGTGGEGESLKRKRGDDMADLEADLEPAPGTTITHYNLNLLVIVTCALQLAAHCYIDTRSLTLHSHSPDFSEPSSTNFVELALLSIQHALP